MDTPKRRSTHEKRLQINTFCSILGIFVALGETHCYGTDLHGNVVDEFGAGKRPAAFPFDDANNLVSQKFFRVPYETLVSDLRSRACLLAGTRLSLHEIFLLRK